MEESIARETEAAARAANASDLWDKHWAEEGDESWRAEALKEVYHRVTQLVGQSDPDKNHILDIGGGRGLLADKLKASFGDAIRTTVMDHSEAALEAARAKGHGTIVLDLEAAPESIPVADIHVSTEVMEHLSARTRIAVLEMMSTRSASAIISVPNNRLGPDEEPQHTIKFTAMHLKRTLKQHWQHVRIEVMGPYLLAVCGELAEKDFTMSVCLPVRDEGRDLDSTLASFRVVADELVVGIDPRTTDNTWEVAEEYADVVFYLEHPMGEPDTKGYMGKDGINFAHVRNQCSAKCTSDWIFMTEGHERLGSGRDTLLRLTEVVPEQARVGFVFRTGQGQRWAFPWLYRNSPDMVWKRPVHNVLDFPAGTYAVQLPQVMTIHERHEDRGAARAVQRKAQNRRQLMDDWRTEQNVNSLFYLGQEWREMDSKRAIANLDKFLAKSNNGVQKYQARLILAKECWRAGKRADAAQYLMRCTDDDWSRTEHWVWLGDMAMHSGDFEKAYRFYMYSATTIGDAPFTMWWIDLCYYSYVPAQRLAMVCGELGRPDEALAWAQRARVLLPPDSPAEAFEEADGNIMILQEAIDAASKQPHTGGHP